MKKIFSLLVAAVATLVLVACGDKNDPNKIRASVWFKSGSTEYSISYRGETAYESKLNGKRYTKGQILPVWEAIGQKLGVEFIDAIDPSDASTDAQWERLTKTGFGKVDVVNGSGAKITEAGQKGDFVDLAKYMDKLPNIATLMKNDPAAKLSMTTPTGQVFYTPYFDGAGELEHMFLARIDWIKKLLDTEVVGASAEYKDTITYEPMNGNEGYTVVVANEKADGVENTRTVTKSATTNIINVLQGLQTKTGKTMLDAFKGYLDTRYVGGQGYAKKSDIFAGTDASYDVDELMALMYVIKANETVLLDGIAKVGEKENKIVPYFQREKADNRIRQFARGLEMFGMRGVNARNEWLFVDKDGVLQDTRGYKDGALLMDGFDQLARLTNDKIVPTNKGYADKFDFRSNFLKGTIGEYGFLTYDYNGTSTVEGLVGKKGGGREKDANFEFQAILPPVNKWDTKAGNEWFHFSESVRSVKSEAWGIPSHVAKNPEKLEKVLKLVDGLYDYTSKESIGSIHLYGPSEWLDNKVESYFNPITGKNDNIWTYKDEAVQERKDLAKGDMIKYLRGYLGATMPIGHIRSLGLEYQTLTESDGKPGIHRINRAVEAGTFRLAGVYKSADNDPFYTPVPTTLPLTQADNTQITATKFRDYTNQKVLIALVQNGFNGKDSTLTREAYANVLKGDKEFPLYIRINREAYQRALDSVK